MPDNISKVGGLVAGFFASANKFPDRPALEVNDKAYSFQDLADVALRIAATILENEPFPEPLAVILAYRSFAAYAGVLGILAAGKGYVPITPYFPVERCLNIFNAAKCNVLIVGEECVETLRSLLPRIEKSCTVIFPDGIDVSDISQEYPIHKFLTIAGASVCEDTLTLPEVHPESVAYLLFTSGSTGVPKGVPVSHNNVKTFLNYVCQRYSFNEKDRFVQTADMTFDLSILEIWPCWESGACLCSIPKVTVMAPAKFIRDKQLTVWISVPSVGIFMSKMRLLRPNFYPTLRYCLFDGEPLLASTATAWQEAAPNAIVDNLYGPTEATVAITGYRWEGKRSLSRCRNGIVPIGWIYPKHEACIIDPEMEILPAGQKGELCISGEQVVKGYFNDSEKTESQFIRIPTKDDRVWYRTGDNVIQDEDGCMHFIERIDNQVKILGHRIELQEVETILREASSSDMVAAVAWPPGVGNAETILGFISGTKKSQDDLLEYCARFLPNYMVPSKIIFLETMPLNANGKIDRSELGKRVKEGLK